MSHPIPILTTERLTLRRPTQADFDAFADWVASPRSARFGGPGPRHEAREGFDAMLDHWAQKGFGYFHVALAASGAAVGRIGISHPDHRPEPEVAYALYEDRFEGQGYATEAARAARDWAFDSLGLPTLVSYIDPDNAASIRLATRLGARPDGTTTGRDGTVQLVYRHVRPEAHA
ncbi:MAG: GNAT family N-acetyltransferase [Maritimibacter sp.]|nr:GNAT family N-acetyltransferase [Maritimibacter sp.]